MDNIFQILKTAKITGQEAAELFNVNRGTVANWLAGKPPRNVHLYEEAKKTCEKLRSLVQRGLLPLKEVPKTERLDMYKRLIDSD